MNTLSPKQYKINWSKKADSAVVEYFLNQLESKTGLKYWIPFFYNGSWFMMTFNNCYYVEVL